MIEEAGEIGSVYKGLCMVCGQPMYGTSARGRPPSAHPGACLAVHEALTQLDTVAHRWRAETPPARWRLITTAVRKNTMTLANNMGRKRATDD